MVFSKKDSRDETDKKWDSALGSVLGAAGGSSVGTSIGKAIEDDGRFDREVTEKDLEKRKIKRASITNEVSIGLNGKPIMKTKTVIEPDCYYEQALNEKNFRKRLKRIELI